MESLLSMVDLLRERYYQDPGFNLFSVLRTESDEVRLHSRFLAELLNPQGQHGQKTSFLKLFLDELEITGFRYVGVQVRREHAGIDIFIRNAEGQAIILENKIYAGDRKEQLHRYVEVVRGSGFKDIHIIYLTLGGTEPSNFSLGELRVQDVLLAGYASHIAPWIETCAGLSFKNAPLRESLVQYAGTVAKLTQTDQEGRYMDKLKTLLLQGDYMLNFNDLKSAYIQNLIDIQFDLWERMYSYQQRAYPEMGEPDVESKYTRKRVAHYYTAARRGLLFGLYYDLQYVDGYVSAEIENWLYFGVYSDNARAYSELCKLIGEPAGSEKSDTWAVFHYPVDELNFKFMPRSTLELLVLPDYREHLAILVIDKLFQYWTHIRAALA